MTSKKHILFLSPGFPADEQDSQCIPALQVFAKAMATQNEVTISVISLHYPQQHGQRTWNGLNVYDAYGKNRLAIFRNVWKWINRIHKQKKIDLIHSFWLTDAAFIGHWVGRLMGISHTITLMGQDVRPSNAYLKWLPLKQLDLIALSPFHAKTYQQTTGYSNTKIIPWGIDIPSPTAPTLERNIDILGVGNLIPLKAYDQFIRIVHKISQTRTINVQIVGDGPEREYLEKTADSLGLKNCIRFCGKTDRLEVLKKMQQTKILLHPSTFESFGFVFLEALAHGASVVSKAVGIAHSSDDWLVGTTESELAKQCIHLLDRQAKPVTSSPFTIHKTIAAYLDHYSSK